MEVLTEQVNLRGSLPRSASNVLEPMLHPESCQICCITNVSIKVSSMITFHFNISFNWPRFITIIRRLGSTIFRGWMNNS